MFRNRIGLIIILFLGCQNLAVSDEHISGDEFYFGYYIKTHNLRDIFIVKLSLHEQHEYLILERFSIDNDELIEEDRTILDRKIIYNNGRTVFIENNKEEHSRNNHVVFDTRNNTDNFCTINYNINNHSCSYSFEYSFFTKNSSEVIELIRSNYSGDAYTGRFVLGEYEIIDIFNMENPINEDEVIVVGIYELRGDLLCLTHFSAGEARRIQPFFLSKRNDSHHIFRIHVDGDNWGHTVYYYFLNKDAIIFEYDWGGINDNEYAHIEYKIKFIRERASE